MHPVKFSRWCLLFFPLRRQRVDFRSFARAGGWWGYRIAGTSVGPTRLELCSALFLSPVSSGTPLVHRSSSTTRRRRPGLARRRLGRGPAPPRGLQRRRAPPRCRRGARRRAPGTAIYNPGHAANRRPHDADDFTRPPSPEQARPRRIIFKVKVNYIQGLVNMDKINSGRLQQVTIGLGW